MPGQLIPAPELAPRVPDDLTPEQAIRTWMDLMDTCDQFLLAGLRRMIGPEGDLQSAYREWYAEQMNEHDRTMNRMIEEFSRRRGSVVR